MGTHPIFESDFDCLTELNGRCLTATFSNMKGASFDSTNRASWFHGTMDRSESIQNLQVNDMGHSLFGALPTIQTTMSCQFQRMGAFRSISLRDSQTIATQ